MLLGLWGGLLLLPLVAVRLLLSVAWPAAGSDTGGWGATAVRHLDLLEHVDDTKVTLQLVLPEHCLQT